MGPLSAAVTFTVILAMENLEFVLGGFRRRRYAPVQGVELDIEHAEQDGSDSSSDSGPDEE